MERAIAGYQRIKRLVDVLAERLLGAPELLDRPAASTRASSRRSGRRRGHATSTPTAPSARRAARFIDRFVAAMDDDLERPPRWR